MVYTAIKKLVQYGLETGLITETDRIYATNQLLEALKLEAYEEPEDPVETGSLEEILRELLDYACEQGLIEKDATVVSVVTGNGLKDVQSGIQAAGEPMRVSPDMDALLAAFAAQDIRP